MLLFHGSNCAVTIPKLIVSDRRLDFGAGFYLTSSLIQAGRWAQLTTNRRGVGTPLVSVFEINDDALEKLNIHRFFKPDSRWLRYVASHRMGMAGNERADVIVGPVANDQTAPTISRYLSGELTAAETLRRLRPQQLKDQYAFRATKGIELLHFIEVLDKWM